MSTWTVRRTVDVLHYLSGIYYRRKYGTLARRMGRPDVSPDGRRGFVVVQIDGLAYEHLLEAMQAGHLSYVSRMVEEGRLCLAPWHCGLPSTTPAVQAAIMFGSRDDIPGFRWYEKERSLAIVTKRPDQVQAVQARLRRSGAGILVGGSSYVNMFDGDADLAFFTMSALHPNRFFESVRGMGLLLLFLLSPFRVLRVLGLTGLGYLRALAWRLVALARRSVVKPYDLLSPLITATANALFTEVQTFGVILDIYRRVPSIYANYNTYDEVAHHLGPTHRAAFATLRDVDRRIRQIDRMRHRYRGREYDLYLLSDHGNAPSVPFSWEVGRSLGQFVAAQAGQETSLYEVFDRSGYAFTKTRYLLDEMRGLEGQVPSAVRRVLRAVRRYVDSRVPLDEEGQGYDLERREDVVVQASGPLAHVYFNVATRRLDLDELALLYPRLVDRLLMMDSIGLVVGRAGEQTVVLGPGGGSTVIGEAGLDVDPPDPLAPYGDAAQVAAELHRLAAFLHSGDLILMGSIRPDGRVVAFEEQVATHGGLGGVQEWPFVAWPPTVDLANVGGPSDLYWLFLERYVLNSGTERPVASASRPERGV